MADEIEIAQEREQGFRNAVIEEHKNKQNRDRELREKMEAAGKVMKCRYCEEPLDGYTSSYCDIDCRREDERLQEALKRNGN